MSTCEDNSREIFAKGDAPSPTTTMMMIYQVSQSTGRIMLHYEFRVYYMSETNSNNYLDLRLTQGELEAVLSLSLPLSLFSSIPRQVNIINIPHRLLLRSREDDLVLT